ncbi:uncharacterized protein LOC111072368 [Drosophila obscura]|uniref:uncharacterized protein LOC111072368 n=1 Tax=Drosophila obscura TaxID=7282 RepID=UPI001BB1DFD9|nr:uncharacterized protein LOC111072368 [Drosophila obscura]
MGKYIRNIRNLVELSDVEEPNEFEEEYHPSTDEPEHEHEDNPARDQIQQPEEDSEPESSTASNENFIGTYEWPRHFGSEGYIFDGITLARSMLNRLGAVETAEAVCDMAYGLTCALNVSSTTSLIPIHGPLVIACVADGVSRVVIGYGVGQCHPHPNVDENGDYIGQSWHREVRGFAIDDDEERCRIITEFIRCLMIGMETNQNYYNN